MLPTVVRSVRAVNTDPIRHRLVDREVSNGEIEMEPYDGTEATVVTLPKGVFDRHCGRRWLNRVDRVQATLQHVAEAALEDAPIEESAADISDEELDAAPDEPEVKKPRRRRKKRNGK